MLMVERRAAVHTSTTMVLSLGQYNIEVCGRVWGGVGGGVRASRLCKGRAGG